MSQLDQEGDCRLKREITSRLREWKVRDDRKPLLITGLRQCGKTYTIRAFGEEEFEDVAYFNFEEDDALKAVFDHDYKTGRILDELGSVIREKTIVPGKTLLVLDEIQECPRAITSLKYFCENMPELHVIAAGSLLGVAFGKNQTSFPVGKVNRMEMGPMSFREFVAADGGEKYLNGMDRLDPTEEISQLYTIPMIRYLKLYYIVGGMPEVVKTWTATHDFARVTEKQDEILKDYENDFGKHAPVEELPRIRAIWESVPIQIARENNKFLFSHVKKGSRAKDLEDAMEWLVNAGLICRLHLVGKPELPLAGVADATYFKVYMADTGLLCRRSNIHFRTILEGDEQFIHFKGALTENYVLTQLKAMQIESFFWRSETSGEVDFITDSFGMLLPIEVKSADNTKAKSLRSFCTRYQPRMAVKSSLKNIGDSFVGDTHLWSLPLYCLFRLKELVERECEALI